MFLSRWITFEFVLISFQCVVNTTLWQPLEDWCTVNLKEVNEDSFPSVGFQ